MAQDSTPPPSTPQRQTLLELAQVFLKLGTIAFGGPAAHLAMMDEEVVNRRQWLSREKLLDLLGMTNLIPGPNSTELAIHIGYDRAGAAGLVVAGVSFILPAMLIVWGLAVLYVRYQTLPTLGWLLYGIKPVIVAIVVQALWKLGKKAIHNRTTAIAGAAVLAGYLIKADEIALLLASGVAVMLVQRLPSRSNRTMQSWVGTLGLGIPSLASLPSDRLASVSIAGIFGIFLKIGCVLYGGGYVLFAFLQRELVDHHHWLTAQQLLDAIAIGQVTPGPLFTSATFVGYLLGGHWGALVATIGIFLPGFVLVWAVHPWVTKLRQAAWTSAFLDGVNAAALALMAGVTYSLGQAALVDGWTIAIAGLSGIMLLRFAINSVWLILAGGLLGLLLQALPQMPVL